MERGYFIVRLIMLLFAIETYYVDIEVEITRHANEFVWLSKLLKEACWLSLG